MNYETYFLKLLLKDSNFLGVNENWFSGNRKKIYIIFKEYFDKYGEIPSDDTIQMIIEDKGYDDKVYTEYIELEGIDLENDISREYILEKLEDEFYAKKLQSAVNVFNKRTDEKVSNKQAYVEVLENLIAYKNESRTIDKGYVYKTAKSRWDEFKRKEAEGGEFKLAGKSFHIDCFDRNMGGRQDATLICAVGLPATGKTTLKLNVAYNLARYEGEDVLYISGELRKKDLEILVDARDAMIDSMLIRVGNLSEALRNRYGECLVNQTKRKDKLYIVEEEPDFTVHDVISHIYEYKKDFGRYPSTIMVDYLWIMKPITKSKDFAESLGNIAKELRHLVAKKFNVNVWTSTQESRSGALLKKQGKERGQESIGESHKIAPHCHTILMLDVNHNPADVELQNKIQISCVKNTLGKGYWKDDLIYLKEYSYMGDRKIKI